MAQPAIGNYENKRYVLETGFKDQPQDAPEVDDLWGYWQEVQDLKDIEVFEAYAFKKWFGSWILVLCERDFDLCGFIKALGFNRIFTLVRPV